MSTSIKTYLLIAVILCGVAVLIVFNSTRTEQEAATESGSPNKEVGLLIERIDERKHKYSFVVDGDMKASMQAPLESIQNYKNVPMLISKGDLADKPLESFLLKEEDIEKLSLGLYVYLRLNDNDESEINYLAGMADHAEQQERIKKASVKAIAWMNESM